MPSSVYTNKPVDVSVKPDTTTLRDKSVVITGGEEVLALLWENGIDPILIGSSGFGESHARAFVSAG